MLILRNESNSINIVSMLSERKEEERKFRQNLILDGALKIFKEQGIDKATMDEIGNASGFGTATLYYYFSSK